MAVAGVLALSLAGFWLVVRPPRLDVPVAAALAPHFTVLLMDLRFFGESGGRVTTLGHRERHDVVQAVHWLARRGAEPIGICGPSKAPAMRR